MKGTHLEKPKGRLADEWQPAAKLAAKYANIDHIAVDAADRQIGEDFDADFEYMEYPTYSPCNETWVNEIFRQTAFHGQKVLLSGLHGNATISQDGLQRLPELLSSGQLGTWWREAAAYVHRGASWRSAFLGLSLRPLLPVLLIRLVQILRRQRQWRLADATALRPHLLADSELVARLKAEGTYPVVTYANNRRKHVVFALRRCDLAGLYKGALGEFKIDYRHPAGDRRLVELSLSLPSRLFFCNGQKKRMYHLGFGERIPSEILDQRFRGYQGADWLIRLHHRRDALKAHIHLALESPGTARLINPGELKDLLKEDLPEYLTQAMSNRYRQRLLPAAAVAHFITNLERCCS